MILYAYYPPEPRAFNHENSWVVALKNIADKYKINFASKAIDGDNLINDLPNLDDKVYLFLMDGMQWNRKHYDTLKAKIPNAEIVMLGTDTHYYGYDREIWPVKLWLDTMKVSVDALSGRFNTEQWFWTISQSIIEELQNYSFINVPPPKVRDAIFLGRTNTQLRTRFFNGLRNEGITVAKDLGLYDISAIADEFSKSWVSIGVTMPAGGFRNSNKSSMKGFRDWIAPFCNTVLIYDDIPDVWYNYPVLTYKYGDHKEAAKIIHNIKQDHELRQEMLSLQRGWALENTIENQFESILNKHNILPC